MSTVTTNPLARRSADIPEAEREAREAGESAMERDNLLTRILLRRRRPLLLVVDSDGELLFSSVPDSAPASEQRLLGEALAEARSLFHWQDTMECGEDERTRSVIDGQGQRSVLVALGNEFYSVRVMRLHGAGDEPDQEQFAALVEPIVEPLTKDVDFDRVKLKYRLSTREGHVLEQLMTGLKDKEIAQRTGLTTGTVRSYLKSIRAKLGVTTRTAIVNIVHEFGSEQQDPHR
jgi:DNA-binding CsgD family transcriptional regulator